MISINILIMTDAEGLCGIYQNEQVKATHPLYGECRRYMTRQINELAAGFKGAGVEHVYVRDCHGGACSAIWEDISADVDRIIQGDTGTNRMPYIESVDAVALLGYHAMAGTPTAVLEHTMMSTLWQKFMIHDTEAGEILLDASIAGDYGKPVILVAGDDYACAEAERQIPGVVTAQLKEAMSCYGASMLSPSAAYALLRKKAAEAVTAYPSIQPIVQPKPVVLSLELIERGQLPHPETKPYMKITGPRSYQVEGSSVAEALFRLF